MIHFTSPAGFQEATLYINNSNLFFFFYKSLLFLLRSANPLPHLPSPSPTNPHPTHQKYKILKEKLW